MVAKAKAETISPTKIFDLRMSSAVGGPGVGVGVGVEVDSLSEVVGVVGPAKVEGMKRPTVKKKT